MALRRFPLMQNEAHACTRCFKAIQYPDKGWIDDDALVFCSPGCAVAYVQENPRKLNIRRLEDGSTERAEEPYSGPPRRLLNYRGSGWRADAQPRDDIGDLNAGISWEAFPWAQADALTRKHSAMGSFRELVEAPGRYYPTIYVDDPERMRLADLYDFRQYMAGDDRRARRVVDPRSPSAVPSMDAAAGAGDLSDSTLGASLVSARVGARRVMQRASPEEILEEFVAGAIPFAFWWVQMEAPIPMQTGSASMHVSVSAYSEHGEQFLLADAVPRKRAREYAREFKQSHGGVGGRRVAEAKARLGLASGFSGGFVPG
jgi:hypothetical protein